MLCRICTIGWTVYVNKRLVPVINLTQIYLGNCRLNSSWSTCWQEKSTRRRNNSHAQMTDTNFCGFPGCVRQTRAVDVAGKGLQAVVSRSDDKYYLTRWWDDFTVSKMTIRRVTCYHSKLPLRVCLSLYVCLHECVSVCLHDQLAVEPSSLKLVRNSIGVMTCDEPARYITHNKHLLLILIITIIT